MGSFRRDTHFLKRIQFVMLALLLILVIINVNVSHQNLEIKDAEVIRELLKTVAVFLKLTADSQHHFNFAVSFNILLNLYNAFSVFI